MRRIPLVFAFCAALGCHASAAQSSAAPGAAVAAHIECATELTGGCRAELPVYVGWRVFQAQCATCHAADARGSSFAPDLIERLRDSTEREFFAALDRGYLGPRSTMPPRGRDPNVAPYYEELWAFLAARRSGVLRAGRVELLESAGDVARGAPGP